VFIFRRLGYRKHIDTAVLFYIEKRCPWVGCTCGLYVGWVRLALAVDGLGWIGSKKMDPSPSLNRLKYLTTVKSFENRLSFDKVIAISWWSTFLEHSVYISSWNSTTIVAPRPMHCSSRNFWMHVLSSFYSRLTYTSVITGLIKLLGNNQKIWVIATRECVCGNTFGRVCLSVCLSVLKDLT